MGRLEDGGQRVTLVPWPHPRVHPVRLQRAAAAALSYDDYLASLEGEDAEEGGLSGSVLRRESLLRSTAPFLSIQSWEWALSFSSARTFADNNKRVRHSLNRALPVKLDTI